MSITAKINKTKMVIKIKNNSLAMPAEAAAIPVKPKTPAIREMIKNKMAKRNIANAPYSEII